MIELWQGLFWYLFGSATSLFAASYFLIDDADTVESIKNALRIAGIPMFLIGALGLLVLA
jgi:hypothetical protein